MNYEGNKMIKQQQQQQQQQQQKKQWPDHLDLKPSYLFCVNPTKFGN